MRAVSAEFSVYGSKNLEQNSKYRRDKKKQRQIPVRNMLYRNIYHHIHATLTSVLAFPLFDPPLPRGPSHSHGTAPSDSARPWNVSKPTTAGRCDTHHCWLRCARNIVHCSDLNTRECQTSATAQLTKNLDKQRHSGALAC